MYSLIMCKYRDAISGIQLITIANSKKDYFMEQSIETIDNIIFYSPKSILETITNNLCIGLCNWVLFEPFLYVYDCICICLWHKLYCVIDSTALFI